MEINLKLICNNCGELNGEYEKISDVPKKKVCDNCRNLIHMVTCLKRVETNEINYKVEQC